MVIESYYNSVKTLNYLDKIFCKDIIDLILRHLILDVNIEHLSRKKLYLLIENDLIKKGLFIKANTYAQNLFNRYICNLKRYQMLHLINKYNIRIYQYCLNRDEHNHLIKKIGKYKIKDDHIIFKDGVIKEKDEIYDIRILRILNETNVAIMNRFHHKNVIYIHLDYLLYNLLIKKESFHFFLNSIQT